MKFDLNALMITIGIVAAAFTAAVILIVVAAAIADIFVTAEQVTLIREILTNGKKDRG